MRASGDGSGMALMKAEILRDDIVGKRGHGESPLVSREVVISAECDDFDRDDLEFEGGKKERRDAGTRLIEYGAFELVAISSSRDGRFCNAMPCEQTSCF